MAAAQTSDPSCTEAQHPTSLKCREVPLASSSVTILCDTSTGLPQPIVPSAYRRLVFDVPHGLYHPDPTLDTSETLFSRPGQQRVSSAPSTGETSVSRADKQTTPPLTSEEIAGSQSTNETAVSRSGS
ncbi:unnamed protein product [Schistosoma mattheei]|uniref:Uncharacterized protein n=1 Tax=Schistosoma mattheei TaxID=31246 RepID=A0A183P4F7_9TREM|nr:unnamed protein product [Schistosoma mattheei]